MHPVVIADKIFHSETCSLADKIFETKCKSEIYNVLGRSIWLAMTCDVFFCCLSSVYKADKYSKFISLKHIHVL